MEALPPRFPAIANPIPLPFGNCIRASTMSGGRPVSLTSQSPVASPCTASGATAAARWARMAMPQALSRAEVTMTSRPQARARRASSVLASRPPWRAGLMTSRRTGGACQNSQVEQLSRFVDRQRERNHRLQPVQGGDIRGAQGFLDAVDRQGQAGGKKTFGIRGVPGGVGVEAQSDAGGQGGAEHLLGVRFLPPAGRRRP